MANSVSNGFQTNYRKNICFYNIHKHNHSNYKRKVSSFPRSGGSDPDQTPIHHTCTLKQLQDQILPARSAPPLRSPKQDPLKGIKVNIHVKTTNQSQSFTKLQISNTLLLLSRRYRNVKNHSCLCAHILSFYLLNCHRLKSNSSRRDINLKI